MQAIILAAGQGERMMPLTKNTPKPLLKIKGKPMIEYVIDLLIYHGVKEIGINLFYLGNKIRKYLEQKKFNIKIIYVEEKKLTGTAGGVRNVAKVLKPNSPFLVVSSDMMVNFNLASIYKTHLKNKGIATLSCYFRPRDQLKKSGVILFDEKTKEIIKFVERPQTDQEIISQWVNSSVYVFDPEILKYTPSKIAGSPIIDLAKHVFPKILSSKEKMFAYPINQQKYYQLGIDTPDRIERAEHDLALGKFKPVKS